MRLSSFQSVIGLADFVTCRQYYVLASLIRKWPKLRDLLVIVQFLTAVSSTYSSNHSIVSQLIRPSYLSIFKLPKVPNPSVTASLTTRRTSSKVTDILLGDGGLIGESLPMAGARGGKPRFAVLKRWSIFVIFSFLLISFAQRKFASNLPFVIIAETERNRILILWRFGLNRRHSTLGSKLYTWWPELTTFDDRKPKDLISVGPPIC